MLRLVRAAVSAVALTALPARAETAARAPPVSTPPESASGPPRLRAVPPLERTPPRGRVSAPRLSHGRLPPLTWSDLARPTPLTADEEADPAVAVLARRFNPAMAFPTRAVWPVEVRYSWHDGSPLVARVVGSDGRLLREELALPHDRLVANDWGHLPGRDNRGNSIHYYVDAPGDDRVHQGVSGWRRRWEAIMGGDAVAGEPPRALEYAPTQYYHLFWFNREKGLLAIQYWFYYPYNEWINHHEGDWERVNVVLRGPTRIGGKGAFRPVGYQFFFHLWTYEPSQVVRIGAQDARDDHVLVYAGGHSRFFLWSGSTSGGSYPLPAVFPAAGGGLGRFRPADDTTRPARFIRPEDFKLVMLPEPERLDLAADPELGWLRLSFFPGHPRVYRNPLALNATSFGVTPHQPARQAGWNGAWTPPYWPETPRFNPRQLRLPPGWQAVVRAPMKAHEAVAARRARPQR